MQDIKRVIFMVLPLLFVPLVYGLSSTPDVCAVQRQSTDTICKEPDDEGWIYCCSFDEKSGATSCEYCRELSPGEWECDTSGEPNPEAVAPGQNLPTLEQVTPTPLFGQNIPQDLQTLTETPETPPTPLPPPPTDPFTTPEDDQNVVDENGDKEDGTPTRPPLRDNLPELKEVPEDDRPEQDEEPSNEGQEDSSDGAETAGPLT